MATIVDFTVNASQFPLGTIFKNVEDVTVELERVVPKTEGVVPYFWVEDIDMADIVAQFSEHPGVRSIRIVDTVGSRHLMKCKWVRKYKGILTGLAKSDIVLLSAVGTEDGWRFEIRGDDADSISTFKEYCENNDISIDITSVSALTEPETAKKLTDTQQEALLLAYERGYFESPPDVTLTDIADELEITQQALSSRIRRGMRRLIANASISSENQPQ